MLVSLAAIAPAAGVWEDVAALPAGALVRVRTLDNGNRTGPLVSADADGLTLTTDGQQVRIIRGDVRRVQVRDGKRRASRAAIGAAIGAGAGLAAAILSCPTCIGELSEGDLQERLAIGALIGGGAGAAIGGLRPGYRTVYQAPKSR